MDKNRSGERTKNPPCILLNYRLRHHAIRHIIVTTSGNGSLSLNEQWSDVGAAEYRIVQ